MNEKCSLFQKIVGKLARGFVIGFMRVAYRPKIYYKCEGGKKKRYKGPAVYVCNHTNIMDGPMIITVLQYAKIYAILAKDWYEKKGLHWLLQANRCIPVDRYHPDTSWLKKAVRVLKSGNSVCIFPEGYISKTGTMRPFKPGFLVLAEMANVPVIPFAMERPYKIFGKRKLVMIDNPYTVEKAPKEERTARLEQEAKRFHDAVESMRDQLKSK